MDDAVESFNMMVKRGCLPDLYSYTIMINAYCKSQRIDEAIHEMKSKKGIFPDIVTFSALINGLFLLKKPQDALEMYQIM
jgi:pentatricopeptide repeat protein